MKNIILTGMMGSGKSTCAHLLSQRLGRPMEDTDDFICRLEGRSVAEIFAAEGEPHFRQKELEAARTLGMCSGCIVATGGGMVLQREAMDALKQNGVVIFLDRPAEQIFDGESLEGRPLAQGGKADFLARFRVRESLYRGTADLTITDFSSPEATVASILDGLHRLGETS